MKSTDLTKLKNLPNSTISELNGKANTAHNHSWNNITSGVPSATTSAKGLVQLSDAINSTSTTLRATANAVKKAYDKANHSHPYAGSSHTHPYLSTGGGTLSGNLTINGNCLNNINYTDRIIGRNRDSIYIGYGNARMEATGDNTLRLYTSAVGAKDSGIRLSPNGSISFMVSSVGKHEFNNNGTKVGGTIEIEGNTYGMSPVDSPLVLIEDIIFDKNLEIGTTKIILNPIFSKSIHKFAVFPSNNKVEVITKDKDYFIVESKENCSCDFRIVGTRLDSKDQYYQLMGGYCSWH